VVGSRCCPANFGICRGLELRVFWQLSLSSPTLELNTRRKLGFELSCLPKPNSHQSELYRIETETVRYVYQPLEELYMVLITNKQSNILQDIDSLHLFAQITQSICRTTDEREILRNAFELLSAFDEAVALGYKENLTLSQVKAFMEMESHEERIQEIISRVIPSTLTVRKPRLI